MARDIYFCILYKKNYYRCPATIKYAMQVKYDFAVSKR